MLKAESANSCSMQMISALREIFIFFDESNFNKLSKIAVQYLNAEPRRLGLCNYGGLIDTLFTDVEGVA